MIIETPSYRKRLLEMSNRQRFIDQKIDNEGLTREDYQKLKDCMVSWDVTVKEYLQRSGTKWNENDRLVLTRPSKSKEQKLIKFLCLMLLMRSSYLEK